MIKYTVSSFVIGWRDYDIAVVDILRMFVLLLLVPAAGEAAPTVDMTLNISPIAVENSRPELDLAISAKIRLQTTHLR